MCPMQDNVPVTMICEDLRAIPYFSLPAPYFWRWFQPGDEPLWQRIQAQADIYNKITKDLFAQQFGTNVELLRERLGFILDAEHRAIATAAAWFNNDYGGQPYGRVHWVAVLPERQGQGLAKPLLSAVCHRLRQLGHERAYLTTSSARIPAINLYLKFGFLPKITTLEEQTTWDAIRREIKTQEERRRHGSIE